MFRIAALSAAFALSACQIEYFQSSYPAIPDAAIDEPRGQPSRAPDVIIDLASLCPCDRSLAVDLIVEGRLLEHEIFDAFVPCEAPDEDVRGWPGLDL